MLRFLSCKMRSALTIAPSRKDRRTVHSPWSIVHRRVVIIWNYSLDTSYKINSLMFRLWTMDHGPFSRYRIIPLPAPGVTAADAFYCKPEALEDALFFKSLEAVVRAGWCKPAFGTK